MKKRYCMNIHNGANPYGLSKKVVVAIKDSHGDCVYCHKKMVCPYDYQRAKDSITLEHLNHLPPWNDPKTVVICCVSCNSSRRNNQLLDWFEKPYCVERNINEGTVAKPVKDYIRKN